MVIARLLSPGRCWQANQCGMIHLGSAKDGRELSTKDLNSDISENHLVFLVSPTRIVLWHQNIEENYMAILGISALIARTGLPMISFRPKISPALTKFVVNASVKTSRESANNANLEHQ